MFDQNKYNREYRLKNKERLKREKHLYYLKNRKKQSEQTKKWRESHPEKMKQYQKKYQLKNHGVIIERSRNWYYEHRQRVLRRIKKYMKDKYSKCPWLKTYNTIRNRVKNKPGYVKYGIKNYLTKDDIKYLWFRDRAYKMNMPSIDRIDGFGNYTLKNCRFLELIDNLKRPKCYRKRKLAKASA